LSGCQYGGVEALKRTNAYQQAVDHYNLEKDELDRLDKQCLATYKIYCAARPLDAEGMRAQYELEVRNPELSKQRKDELAKLKAEFDAIAKACGEQRERVKAALAKVRETEIK
jgi:hypothetical protein